MTTPSHIFVYGLLTFPEVVKAIIGRDVPAKPAVLSGFRRYGLSKSPLETPVPVLLPEAGFRQAGQLLFDVSAEEIELLDFFEDLDSGHYEKTPVRVEVAGQWFSAFCYSAGPALAPYACGDWDPDNVKAADKERLIQYWIPEMLAGRLAQYDER